MHPYSKQENKRTGAGAVKVCNGEVEGRFYTERALGRCGKQSAMETGNANVEKKKTSANGAPGCK